MSGCVVMRYLMILSYYYDRRVRPPSVASSARSMRDARVASAEENIPWFCGCFFRVGPTLISLDTSLYLALSLNLRVHMQTFE